MFISLINTYRLVKSSESDLWKLSIKISFRAGIITDMLITTRLAKFEDIPELNRLIALSVRGLSTAYYTSAQIESALKYVFGVDTQKNADGTYNVAEINNTMVGCGGWSKRNTLYGGDQHKDKEDPLLDTTTDAARIRAL